MSKPIEKQALKTVVLEITPKGAGPFELTFQMQPGEQWWSVAKRLGTTEGAVDENRRMYYPPHGIREIRMVSGAFQG